MAAPKKSQSQFKITNTAVRNVGNVVFYVDTAQTLFGVPAGYHVRIKHYNNDRPLSFDHIPTDDELAKLWKWR